MAQEMKVDFTTQDKKEALAKLKKAALEYKTRYTPRSLGGMAGLSGFDGTKIPPTILRSLLAKTFDLNLSRREYQRHRTAATGRQHEAHRSRPRGRHGHGRVP